MTLYKALPIVQKDTEFFVVVADPRKINKITQFANEKETQDYQRPWKKKKVLEIAKLVGGEMNLREGSNSGSEKKYAKGIIPNCPILHLLDNTAIIEKEGSFYLDTGNESKIIFASPIDGQHRLLSFDEDICKLKNYENYEMAFIVFKNLQLDLMRELFIICNDKQESVPKDITLNQKKAMGLLTNEKERLYTYVIALNEEVVSPYKGRVKINGAPITNGLSPEAMIRSLHDSDFTSKFKPEKQQEKLLIYISAWKEVFKDEIMDLKHPLSKSNGFRFIMKMMTQVYQIIHDRKGRWTNEEIEVVLNKLKGICVDQDIFNPDYGHFGGQSPTDSIARKIGADLLSEHEEEGYEL